ncbi:uncharacterized protein LOC141714194 [Apium graveolens]|uniref:uncharacterized protein LOC141714194 n=1 Tax=Apium graveolens TaxID=4045 RepID=UPI003D7BC142
MDNMVETMRMIVEKVSMAWRSGNHAIKGQALTDFLLEFDSKINVRVIVLDEPYSYENIPRIVIEEFPHPWWILHVDEAVNDDGVGARIVQITSEEHHLMSTIHFKFCATNNDAEYEALINDLKMASEVKVVNWIALSDSELVVNQVNVGYQARRPQTELYMRCVQRSLRRFGDVRLEGVPRE